MAKIDYIIILLLSFSFGYNDIQLKRRTIDLLETQVKLYGQIEDIWTEIIALRNEKVRSMKVLPAPETNRKETTKHNPCPSGAFLQTATTPFGETTACLYSSPLPQDFVPKLLPRP